MWDKDAGKDAAIECDNVVIDYVKHGEEMKMEMTKDPEDLPSPTEIVQKVFWGLPNEYAAAVEHLDGNPFNKYKVQVPKVDEKNETEVVA